MSATGPVPPVNDVLLVTSGVPVLLSGLPPMVGQGVVHQRTGAGTAGVSPGSAVGLDDEPTCTHVS